MSGWRRVALVALLLLVAGCSKPPPAGGPSPPPDGEAQGPGVGAPAAQEPEAREPADAEGEPEPATAEEVAALNDRAYLLLKEKRWDEAEQASREALAIDPKSSAAWFNLGRAQLGRQEYAAAYESFRRASELTGGQSADVEYNLIFAQFQMGDAQGARKAIDKAVEAFGRDPDFLALRERIWGAPLSRRISETAYEVDFDGDGLWDTFTLEQKAGSDNPWERRLKVTSGTGELLYEADVYSSAFSDVRVMLLPDGSRMAHVAVLACPSAPQNEFLLLEPQSGTVRNVSEKGMCASWNYEGDGRFSVFTRLYFPVAGYAEYRWEDGRFVAGEHGITIYARPTVHTIDSVLSDVARLGPGQAQGLEHLFATPDLQARFWAESNPEMLFEVDGPEERRPLRLRVREEGKPDRWLLLTLLEEDGLLITGMKWSDSPDAP